MMDLQTIKALNKEARGMGEAVEDRLISRDLASQDLYGALTWLLDDLTDAGEVHNNSGVEYDTCKHARAVLEKYKHLEKNRRGGGRG